MGIRLVQSIPEKKSRPDWLQKFLVPSGKAVTLRRDIEMRCLSMNPGSSLCFEFPDICMPAVMTIILPCCLGQRADAPRMKILSMATYILCSNLPEETGEGARYMMRLVIGFSCGYFIFGGHIWSSVPASTKSPSGLRSRHGSYRPVYYPYPWRTSHGFPALVPVLMPVVVGSAIVMSCFSLLYPADACRRSGHHDGR